MAGSPRRSWRLPSLMVVVVPPGVDDAAAVTTPSRAAARENFIMVLFYCRFYCRCSDGYTNGIVLSSIACDKKYSK